MRPASLLWPLLAGCGGLSTRATVPCDEDPSFALHPRSAEYQELLERFWEDNQMPAAVVGVQQQGMAPWVGALGYSNLETSSPMQTCTPFRTGSVSKMILGTLVVRLADQGRFGLDDPITEYLPDLGDEIPGSEAITVRELLDHTSGLPHPSDDNLRYQLSVIDDPLRAAARPYEDKLKSFVYGHKLRFDPGTDSYYSNAGYWVLAQLVERETGMSLRDALEVHLFEPNALYSMRLSEGDDPELARGYSPMDGHLADVTLWDRADSDGDPAGGVAANAADLLAFAGMLFDHTLVSEEMLGEMTQTKSFPSCGGDCEYGLGIESLYAYPSVGYGKNGSLPGVDANLFYFPQPGLALVIFSNFGAGNLKDAFAALFE